MLAKIKSLTSQSSVILIFLISLTLFTRFIKLDWGDGNFFHPDEFNMASAISQISLHSFNPHFFAYGQFPLYLVFFTYLPAKLIQGFGVFSSLTIVEATLALRFYSALFSSLTVLVLSCLVNRRYRLSVTLLAIFSPGLIQLAHFGTTESLLIFVFAANSYLAIKYFNHRQNRYLFFAAIIAAIGLGSKLTAVFFALPFCLSLIFVHQKNCFKSLLIYAFLTLIFTALFSPYSLVDFSDFRSAIHYESTVATGILPVFYTNQFLNTRPYWFQLTKIFPYALGLPLFIFCLFSVICGFIHKSSFINRKSLIILLPSLFYLLYNGQLYVKWFRFMSPLFILFPLVAAYALGYFKSRFWSVFLLFILLLPGLNFLRLYTAPDIRQTASNWLVENIPASTRVLSEAGNVVNLPMANHQLLVTNFDFYNLDANPQLPSQLATEISQSDYLLVPSRRIFKNQQNSSFPISNNYYTNLFNGRLGFIEIKEFSNAVDWPLSAENAEETYSVFDHPTIRIYKKFKDLTVDQISLLLLTT